jgi:superfamily II DNA helicase RecQ
MGSKQIDGLWRNNKFTSRIMCFVLNEGHCVSQWGGFRTEYRLLGNLRYLIPESIPTYVASATMPLDVLHDVTETLHLWPQNTEHITCSNDQPNIHLIVQEIKYSVSSYTDLAFLIPDNFKDGDTPPEKFLVFFDNTKEAEAAVKYLRTRLPPSLREKVKWFHSTMTSLYWEEEFEALKMGGVWGMCVTDAFGMVSIPSHRDSRDDIGSYVIGSGSFWYRNSCSMESEVRRVHLMAKAWTGRARRR